MSDLKGCGDSLCYIEKPKGMATNGGCRCRPHKLYSMIMRLRKRVEELEEELQQEETDSDHYCKLVLKYRKALREIPEDRGRYMDSAEIVDRHHEIPTTAIASSKPMPCSECAGTGYEFQNVKHPSMIPCRKCGTVKEEQYTSIVVDGEEVK